MAIEKRRLQSSIMMVINNSDKQFHKLNFKKLPSYKITRNQDNYYGATCLLQ